MVNNEASDDSLGVQGSQTVEFTQGNSLPNEPHASDSNTYSPTPTSTPTPAPVSNGEVENTRLSPTSLYCSVPLNKDVQNIIESFSKTEMENVAKKIRKIPCLYCDRTFVAETLRQKHVERIHSVKQARRSSSRLQQPLSGSVSCFYCEKFTLNENRLDELFLHLVTVHQEKYFGCLACKERFISFSHLQEHNENSHGVKYKNDVQWLEEASDNSSAINEHDMLKTKHKAKTKKEIASNVIAKARMRRTKHVTPKVLRSKRIALRSTKLGIKRSTRLQTKLTSGKNEKRRPKQKEQIKLEKDKESTPDSDNPYPTFDAFYRVKKITDHSIDNIRISSLTFNDVFDQAFFTRINCNIRENLLNHLDGKLFKNEESENRISNFEKTQTDYTNTENFGCEISLNAATPIATNVLTAQFGDDPETQIEYGSKASKKKIPPKQDEVHYKYFTRRKYQASILESKENRDLSKLDMWTQFVIKTRQQKIEASQKTDKEKVEYKKRGEYRAKLANDELNRILDRRGPFEDLKEEANKKAALECNFNQEAHADVACILDDLLDNVFSQTEVAEVKTELTDSEIPAYLNLRKASLNNETYIDKSDRITLICSSQETENFEEPQRLPKDKNATVELTGEWARSRLYICAACGLKLANMKLLMDHKNIVHQNVWCQHYEFVGNQGEFYKHLSIPGLGKMNYIEENLGYKTWKRSDARVCSKCKKQCNSLGELHRHILECGEDWTWMLVRKKLKYKPFGSKTRKKRRGLFKRIIQKDKLPDENRVKRKYKKRFEGPRPKPSDAETIERMLANLPAKRATRKMVCLKDGLTRRRNNVQSANTAPMQQTSNKMKKMRIRRNRAELLLQESNVILKGKVVKSISTKCNPALHLRKSVRNVNKVISSKLMDTTNNLMVKRKLMNALHQQQRITRRTLEVQEENELKQSNEEIPDLTPEPMIEEVEVKKKTNIIKKIKNAFKNTSEKNEENDVSTEILDNKLEEVMPQDNKLNENTEKIINKKNTFASKLIRTLSVRKRKDKTVEALPQESTDKVQKISVSEDSKITKNNGKRKSTFESVKRVVKKMKVTRKTKKDNKLIHKNDSLIVGDHFLEEGSNTLSAGTAASELKESNERKECTNPDEVIPEVDNVVKSVEPPASEAISESIIDGQKESTNHSTDNNEKQNIQKQKVCKRSKGLNACIAMLTNKLLQKDEAAPPKVDVRQCSEEKEFNIEKHPIDLSKNEIAPLIVPSSKTLLQSSIMEQDNILEHKSIEPISSQANLPSSEDMHVEKVENIIKSYEDVKSLDPVNGIGKSSNGLIEHIQSVGLNPFVTKLGSFDEREENSKLRENIKVQPRKIGQRRPNPKKMGRKPKVVNPDVILEDKHKDFENLASNLNGLGEPSPIFNFNLTIETTDISKSNLLMNGANLLHPRTAVLEKIVENCKHELFKQNKNNLVVKDNNKIEVTSQKPNFTNVILEIPNPNNLKVSSNLNYSKNPDLSEDLITNNVVKTSSKRGRKKKIFEPANTLLPTISEERNDETSLPVQNLLSTPSKRKTRKSVQNILKNEVSNTLPKLYSNVVLNVENCEEVLENKTGADLISQNSSVELDSNLIIPLNQEENAFEITKRVDNGILELDSLDVSNLNQSQLEHTKGNIIKTPETLDFKNFVKDHSIINHSINNILESVASVQTSEFNVSNTKNEFGDGMEKACLLIQTNTPKGKRRRKKVERRTIAIKTKHLENVLNDFTDNNGCIDFSQSMLDNDLNLVDDSSKENFGGIIKSDSNIVSNQINEVNSKSPNNKEVLEINNKLETKHVCEELINDLPIVNSEVIIEASKPIISKFKFSADLSNNCCQEEKSLNLPNTSAIVKTPKTDHFIGNILRPPKLNLFDPFKTKPLISHKNEEEKILISDKLESTPVNNDNLLFTKSTQISNIFNTNESFKSLNPFKNDFNGTTGNLVKSNSEDIYNFEDKTESLEKVIDKTFAEKNIFAKNIDLTSTFDFTSEKASNATIKSKSVTTIFDATDSEDELPLSIIKSKIQVQETSEQESPTLNLNLSNVDVENNIPLGDVAPTFDNSIISTPTGEGIASSTDEINHSQSEDTMYYSKSSHEDLIIRLRTKNKKKKGSKKFNEYVLDNSRYEHKTNHEILDTIFNEIVNEMKDKVHRHRKKSKKKKNSSKERRFSKTINSYDDTENFDSFENHNDELQQDLFDINFTDKTDIAEEVIALNCVVAEKSIVTEVEEDLSFEEKNEEKIEISMVKTASSKRKRGRPKVSKPILTEVEYKGADILNGDSLKTQSSVYDFNEFTENEDTYNIFSKSEPEETPKMKTRPRINKPADVYNELETSSSLLESENEVSYESLENCMVNEESLKDIEINTPVKEDQSSVDNNDSYLQTPDMNNSIISKKVQAKLNLKPARKKKGENHVENNGVENFCDICNKRFIRVDSLAKHKRTLTHIAKLSEIEAREAAEKAKKIENEKVLDADCINALEYEAEELRSKEEIIEDEGEKLDLLSESGEIEKEVIPIPPNNIHNLSNNVILASQFSLSTNTNSLKLADIISDVIPTGVGVNANSEMFSSLNNPCETKRYKSLGERKSFDSDTVGYNSPSSFSNHKISATTDSFLDKQISILENIIEENKASLQYMDEMSVASNKSDDRCPSDMSLVSDIKPDDSNIISFSHSTNIVNSIIHPDGNFVKPTQYEEISEDSTNTRNFDEHRARKVLNRDEELFLECCSLLKSSSEVSNFSKKSTSRTISMVNSYALKPEEEPDFLERKNFSPKHYSQENKYISEDSCPATPIGENYEDYSNSNTSKTQWTTGVREKEFDNISPDSSDDDNGNDADFSYYELDDKNDDNLTLERPSTETNSQCSIISNEENSNNFEFRKKVDVKFEGIVAEALKINDAAQKGKSSKKAKHGEPMQTSITDYVVPLPKRSDNSSCSFSSDSKRLLTKGAMKIFEGLKVSIPTEDLDMKEVLNCSPTSKRLELEFEPVVTPEIKKNKVTQKPKLNLKKMGNKLGLKVTKKRVKTKKAPAVLKITKPVISDENKTLDIYDFEETQDNTDLFIPNNLSTFRTQVAEKNKPCNEFPNIEGIESDSESNNHYIDSFSMGTQSSFSTENESLNSKESSSVNNVTKKKCVIMGRIFKNAIKPKDEIKDVDSSKLVESLVLKCEGGVDDKRAPRKMSEKEMDMLFDKLLEESKNQKCTKPDETITQVMNEEEVEPLLKHIKSKSIKHKKRGRKISHSSDDEFNLSKAPKKRTVKKKIKEDAINLEQELKECMGVAGRKSQRKCTSGKQNVLIEYWSSDDSDFEALLQQTLQPSNKSVEAPKIKKNKVLDEPKVDDSVLNEFAIPEEIKKDEGIEDEEIPPINPEVLNEIIRDVKEGKKKVRRKSSNKPRDDSGVRLKNPTEETLASNRRKRAAAETLYYWSSSSDDDSQNLIEVKSVRDEVEEEDRPMQHGWIVGDSPKKLVTMLAQAKGKKLDTKCVKEQGKKRTTL